MIAIILMYSIDFVVMLSGTCTVWYMLSSQSKVLTSISFHGILPVMSVSSVLFCASRMELRTYHLLYITGTFSLHYHLSWKMCHQWLRSIIILYSTLLLCTLSFRKGECSWVIIILGSLTQHISLLKYLVKWCKLIRIWCSEYTTIQRCCKNASSMWRRILIGLTAEGVIGTVRSQYIIMFCCCSQVSKYCFALFLTWYSIHLHVAMNLGDYTQTFICNYLWMMRKYSGIASHF